MRARISGWMIADGDLEVPVRGNVLKQLALRLDETPRVTAEGQVVVEGTTTWARFDDANGFLESVVTTDRFRVLTQESAAAADRLPAIGSSVRRVGRLRSVGHYEFEAFALPDVTQSWLVLDVQATGPLDDLMVELEPVDFRFDV